MHGFKAKSRPPSILRHSETEKCVRERTKKNCSNLDPTFVEEMKNVPFFAMVYLLLGLFNHAVDAPPGCENACTVCQMLLT